MTLSTTPPAGTGPALSAGLVSRGVIQAFILTLLLASPPTCFLCALTGVSLFVLLRRKGVSVAWPFVVAGVIEGAVLLPLAWRWFWGFGDPGLFWIGSVTGGVAGLVFWDCVRGALPRLRSPAQRLESGDAALMA